MAKTSREISIALGQRWLAALILIAAFLLIIRIPSLPAQENQDPPQAKLQPQPAVPVAPGNTRPDSEKELLRVLDDYEASNSIDFLMEDPPLSQNTVSGDIPAFTPPAKPSAEHESTTLQPFPDMTSQKHDEVSMLVSEQCSHKGTDVNGTNSCVRTYSNGRHSTVRIQNETEGDTTKQETVVQEFDENRSLLYKKTIRHRLDQSGLSGHKAKDKELFDITYQPAGERTTREFTVYEYFPDTEKIRALSWTQYRQTGNASRAELVYHAMLRYGEDGGPERGIAEKWRNGERSTTFLNWSRRAKGFATLDETAWEEWEKWIRNVSMQAYLP